VPGAGDGRVVSYTNDSAGRLASLSSAATTYAPGASVSSIGYASHNAPSTETYGNSLVHAMTYNNRLQPNEIKLGTSGAPTSVVDLVYNYGTTNNNGNVQSVSYAGGGLSYTQTFGYDQLNRLTTSQENSGSSWSQTNGYDRYGNRWIDLGGGNSTTPMTNNNGNLKKQEIFVPGSNSWLQQYDYDNLNRLQRVHEYTGNTSLDWQQEYVYDRYGNRTIHQTNTWGTGINKKDFTANAANNNRLGVPGGQSGTMSYDPARKPHD
jgi:hypothetical protein